MDAAIKRRISQIEKGEVPEGYKWTKAGLMPADWIMSKSYQAKDIFYSITNKRHGGKLVVLSSTQECGIVPRSSIDIDIKYTEDNLGSYKKVECGDFVISLRSFQGGIEYSEYIGIVSPAYTVIKSKIPIENGYYKFYFKTADFIKRLNIGTYGIRDGKQIGFADFGDLVLHYPPLNEQQKIAEILQAQDRMIELKERLLALKQQQKKYLMQQLLTGKIRLPGFTGEWKKIELGEIFDYFQPTAYIVNSTNYVRSGVPVLTAGKTFILGYTDEMDGVFQDTPAVLFDDFTTSSQYVDFRFKVKSSAVKILKCKSYFNDIVAFYKLQSVKYVVGNHERHWISKFSNIPVLMPPIEEQTAIAEVLSTADAEIGLLKKDIEQEKLKKKSLMQLLLTGIVRV